MSDTAFRPVTTWGQWLASAPYFTSAIMESLDAERAAEAAPLVRAAWYYDLFDGEVSNGGVMQYYYNRALDTPGFDQVPAFVAQNPHLAEALPFVKEVHAAWAVVAPAVIAAQQKGGWPEELFAAHRERFEALENAFFAVNHRISQRLCAAIVQSPHDYFDIADIPELPARGVAHIVLHNGTQRLRFENGFPVGPNLLEQRNGECDVVWFTRDRRLLLAENAYAGDRNRSWIHYPSQTSGSWHFQADGRASHKASRALWIRHGLEESMDTDGRREQAAVHLQGEERISEGYFPDGRVQYRREVHGREIRELRWWPNGALNTENVEGRDGRARYLRCLDEHGQELAPAGTGPLREFLGIDEGRHLWREGRLEGGFIEGELRWMSSEPDGSDAHATGKALYRKGREA